MTLVPASQPVKQSELTRLPDGEWQSNAHPEAIITTKGNTITFSDLGENIIVEGEYSVTKDNIAYGVVTSAKLDIGEDKLEMVVRMVDETFSFRYRVDGDRLIIKDLKIHHVEDMQDIHQTAEYLIDEMKKKNLHLTTEFKWA